MGVSQLYYSCVNYNYIVLAEKPGSSLTRPLSACCVPFNRITFYSTAKPVQRHSFQSSNSNLHVARYIHLA